MLQVTLSIELNGSHMDEFERIIPVQLAQPPWNYTLALSKGITVRIQSGGFRGYAGYAAAYPIDWTGLDAFL